LKPRGIPGLHAACGRSKACLMLAAVARP
jgi:hypothetical protein